MLYKCYKTSNSSFTLENANAPASTKTSHKMFSLYIVLILLAMSNMRYALYIDLFYYALNIFSDFCCFICI